MNGFLLTLVLLAQLTPRFSEEGLVNAASSTRGAFAPGTLITLYGENLSFRTRALIPDDIKGRVLPTTLTGTGVRIMIANHLVNLYYVSPGQINLLIPSHLLPGVYNFELIRDGLLSRPIPIEIVPESPEFFVVPAVTESGNSRVIAIHVDGSVVDPGSPAEPGEVIVLFATGLGRVKPPVPYGEIATSAASIANRENFKVYLNDLEVDSHWIEYAGTTPGFGGLYQINFRVPEGTPGDPRIRMGFSLVQSVEGTWLAVRSTDTPVAVSDPASSLTESALGSR